MKEAQRSPPSSMKSTTYELRSPGLKTMANLKA